MRKRSCEKSQILCPFAGLWLMGRKKRFGVSLWKTYPRAWSLRRRRRSRTCTEMWVQVHLEPKQRQCPLLHWFQWVTLPLFAAILSTQGLPQQSGWTGLWNGNLFHKLSRSVNFRYQITVNGKFTNMLDVCNRQCHSPFISFVASCRCSALPYVWGDRWAVLVTAELFLNAHSYL